ncbi:hypothetical protein CARUB_v10001207mg [Capsella rubella]|uniref:Response regulatory domain-containing protein n=1 Tax=Capsella rubella TaxID=81985 RepID=R0H7M1_9BRAS|nr:putative two-component response regulator-like APRR8 [Capsella rubella]EOA20870.1 hypothetical protein CARUB_v10001207mg [Capsella rubella]
MNGEEDFRPENTKATERFSDEICFLLLDSDATFLANMSEMMRECGYKVVATTRADDVPLIINNKDEKIDLVLAEFRLIEMNKYELLEKIRLTCEIPVVVLGAYVKDAIVECLRRGAELCLMKPLMERDLKILWQLTARKQWHFLSQIDINTPEKNCSITHSQSLGDKLKNNEPKTEDENLKSGDQKKPELGYPEMQNEFRETDAEFSQGKTRKDREDTDTGEQTEKDWGAHLGQLKKPKLISAEEANNERKEPTEIMKNGEGSEKKEELEKSSSQPVTAAYEKYVFSERDFQPLETVGEPVGPDEIPLSPRESSNNNAAAQLQVQAHGPLDKELMQDGISLSDLEDDLQEGQDSNEEVFNESSDEEVFNES